MSKKFKRQVNVIKFDILKGTLSLRYVLLFSGALYLVIKITTKTPTIIRKTLPVQGATFFLEIVAGIIVSLPWFESWSSNTLVFVLA